MRKKSKMMWRDILFFAGDRPLSWVNPVEAAKFFGIVVCSDSRAPQRYAYQQSILRHKLISGFPEIILFFSL